ncbi:PLP-dependent aminotransferase family protein [Thorsellia anophelis]|uniref:DNA-binding transcriptional regulator, MocR family, contains an aminotransferase domain n=1 Tax=Thorsellia anophelis DSM 18579 TaxID=1123402 RepID=A0A1I0DUN2_9GAMM|nr:PLP-dependent aminotransferase family protein [Thorsellia anophelis]SET36355.1 DNA-binding transcriptional regulator, MocR family, contains an aminotransferase domain [Thorsellia anophelis DSM 18579]
MLSQKSANIKSSPVRELLKYTKKPEFISLAGGIPATDMLDVDGIDTIIQDILAIDHRQMFQYSVTEGEAELRTEITKFNLHFDLHTPENNILITNGSQQAIDLLSRVFLEKGDKVLVERPTYLAALQLFSYTDAEIEEVSYQNNAIDLEALRSVLADGQVKMLYLIPNFANPTGHTLDYQTREQIVKLVHEYHVIVVEDDPYGYLRFEGEMVPSLYAIAQSMYGNNHNICYMSSFSKIFAPGLRLGWLAAPDKFLSAIVVAKQALDLHTSTFNQHIAAKYLASGRLMERLSLLQTTYKHRRDLLINALKKHLGDKLSYNTPSGGMFLWCHINLDINATDLLAACIEEKVIFVPGEVFFAKHPDKKSLRLSYSMLTNENADEAAIRIAKAIEKLQ